jgi:rod shape-determining protein MreD
MNWLKTAFLLGTAFLTVFWEAAFDGVRHLLGGQVDLLPALTAYAALHTDLSRTVMVAVCGGLFFDSLSATPLGISVLPLLVIGVVIYSARELILKDEVFAQGLIGLAVSIAAPVITLIVLLTIGHTPILGWGTLWQLFLMTLGGAIALPLWVVFFEWLESTFSHDQVQQPSFRPDREIRRGR